MAAKMALPRTLTMHMEQKDIEAAICGSKSKCAIAQNIYRELKIEVGRVKVDTSGVSIRKDGYRYYYKVPHRACRLVADFDAGKDVQPIPFALKFSHRKKEQKTSEARKAQINAAREARLATLAALGQKPKQYPRGRYGI